MQGNRLSVPKDWTSKAKRHRSQSALEYLTSYAWALLIIIVASTLLYIYLRMSFSLPSTCTFTNGFYCKDIILQSNTVTHNTFLTVALTNAQAYAIGSPKLFVSINATNGTMIFACSPNFVLPGGGMICTANIPISTNLGVILAGDMYLNATYCGLLGNYIYTSNCVGAPKETYHGTFTGHTETQISTTTSITLNALNTTQYSNNGKDPLRATVKLNGYPISGATVHFTVNAVVYSISPLLTDTNSTGVALSYVWGATVGSALVTATYAGMSNSVTISFATPPSGGGTTSSVPTVGTSLSTTTSAVSSTTSTTTTTSTSSTTSTTSASTTTSVSSSTSSAASSSTSTSTSSVTTIASVGCSGYNSFLNEFTWTCMGASPSCASAPPEDPCTCDSGDPYYCTYIGDL